VIDELNVRGTITINNPGVIIKNCQAEYIIVNAENVTIRDATVLRCDISGVENGIWLEGSGCLIKDNYLHNFIAYDPQADPHIDGLQIAGNQSVADNLIVHNNFDLALVSAPNADNGINACITMASTTNIDISANRFSGGGYNIYFEQQSVRRHRHDRL